MKTITWNFFKTVCAHAAVSGRGPKPWLWEG